MRALFNRAPIKAVQPEKMNKNTFESEEELNIKFVGSNKPVLNIGRGTYMNGVELFSWDSRIKIDIGRYCSFADNITVVAGGEHDTDWVSTYPFISMWKVESLTYMQTSKYKGDIKIGNDVWIANNVVILSGVTIADGAVIGAGSVVVNNIPPYCIAAGNPARIIRQRFSAETIEKLLKIRWWDWDKRKIHENLHLFNKIDEFIEVNKA